MTEKQLQRQLGKLTVILQILHITLALLIAGMKDAVVKAIERQQYFDSRIGYDNQLTEEGSEKRVDIYDFCHTEGQVSLLLRGAEYCNV